MIRDLEFAALLKELAELPSDDSYFSVIKNEREWHLRFRNDLSSGFEPICAWNDDGIFVGRRAIDDMDLFRSVINYLHKQNCKPASD